MRAMIGLVVVLLTALALAACATPVPTSTPTSTPPLTLTPAPMATPTRTHTAGLYNRTAPPLGKLAFTYGRIGLGYDIWVKDFTTGESHKLVESSPSGPFRICDYESNNILRWSQDSSAVYFSSCDTATQGAGAYKVSLATRQTTKVPVAPTASQDISNNGKVLRSLASFSTDEIVAKKAAVFWISSVDDPDTRQQAIDLSDRFEGVAEGRWSPDANMIAFEGIGIDPQTLRFNDKGLYVYDVRTGQTKEIFHPATPALSHLSWSPDGKRILFSAACGEPPEGWWDVCVYDFETGKVTRVTANGGSAASMPNWAPDGSKVVYTDSFLVCVKAIGPPGQIQDARTSDRKGKCPDPDAAKVTEFYNADETASVWSPNGRYIAYLSNRGTKTTDVLVVESNGFTTNITARQQGSFSSPSWSPDGQRLVVVRDTILGNSYAGGGAASDIYIFSAQGELISQVTNTADYERHPKFSPSGALIGFVRWSGSRSASVYVTGVDGVEQRRVTEGDCRDFDWAADDNSIIATCDDGSGWKIIQLDINSGQSRLIVSPNFFPLNTGWSRKSGLIAFAEWDYKEERFKVYTLDPKTQTEPTLIRSLRRVLGQNLGLAWSISGTSLTGVYPRQENFTHLLQTVSSNNENDIVLLSLVSVGPYQFHTFDLDEAVWWDYG